MFFLIVLRSINNLGTSVEILAPIWNLYTQKKIVHSVQYPSRTIRNTAFSRGQIIGYGSCGSTRYSISFSMGIERNVEILFAHISSILALAVIIFLHFRPKY